MRRSILYSDDGAGCLELFDEAFRSEDEVRAASSAAEAQPRVCVSRVVDERAGGVRVHLSFGGWPFQPGGLLRGGVEFGPVGLTLHLRP